MSEAKDGSFGVNLFDGEGAFVCTMRAPSRALANRLRRVVAVWDGPRDAKTLVELCEWSLHAGSHWWYSTIIAMFKVGWRYSNGRTIKPER